MAIPSVDDLKKYIDQQGLLDVESELFQVPVRIQDARVRFGHVDYFVIPIGGEGGTWIESGRFHKSGEESNERTQDAG